LRDLLSINILKRKYSPQNPTGYGTQRILSTPYIFYLLSIC